MRLPLKQPSILRSDQDQASKQSNGMSPRKSLEVPDDDDGAGHDHFQNNFLKKSRWGSQFNETPT